MINQNVLREEHYGKNCVDSRAKGRESQGISQLLPSKLASFTLTRRILPVHV
jgi:hypothetical protein